MKLKKNRRPPIRRTVQTRRRSGKQVPVLFPEMSDNPWFTTLKPVADRAASGLTTVELCAGAGGQALGYEQAGMDHAALVELDKHACATLRMNRPGWCVIEQDLNTFCGT